jgi:hypothetical protein
LNEEPQLTLPDQNLKTLGISGQAVAWTLRVAAESSDFSGLQPGYAHFVDSSGVAKAQQQVMLGGILLGIASALIVELLLLGTLHVGVTRRA